MFRTNTCGELRISDVNKQVTLSGWVQRSRKMGGMTFIDLRDRYGITQLVLMRRLMPNYAKRPINWDEFVIQVVGIVNERFNKNANIPTGDIEIIVSELHVLNAAVTPPFTIEDNTDGEMIFVWSIVTSTWEEMRFVQIWNFATKWLWRCVSISTVGIPRSGNTYSYWLNAEGARDFVVPSRMNRGNFMLCRSRLSYSNNCWWFRASTVISKLQSVSEMRIYVPTASPNLHKLTAKWACGAGRRDYHLWRYGQTFVQNHSWNRNQRTICQNVLAWCHETYGSDKPDIRFGMQFVELMDVLKDMASLFWWCSFYRRYLCRRSCNIYS